MCVCVCPVIRTRWLASQNVRVVPQFVTWLSSDFGHLSELDYVPLLENPKVEQMSALLSLRVETIPDMKK